MHNRGIFTAIFVILTALTSLSAADGNDLIRLPENEDSYFCNNYLTGSEYYHFKPDGTYSRINREHMFVEEGDKGTWAQDKDGTITLSSQMRYRNIDMPPLMIYVMDKGRLDYLPEFKKKLAAYLDNITSETLTADETRNIERYGQNNCLSRIDVDYFVNTVKKDDLRKLLTKIDAYLADDKKNQFFLFPYSYKNYKFLAQDDKAAAVAKNMIDTIKAGSRLAYVFTPISKEQFDRESKTTQEFLYYKNMNKKK